jgi:Tfp pilus assembly protein PilF
MGGENKKLRSFSLRSLANDPLVSKAPAVGVHIACLVLLILIIYSNTLNAPFQWDESLHLVDNPLVKDLRYFAHPAEGRLSEQYKFFVSRYIAFLTFALNYRIHGLSVTGYHIVNIAIHIANSILVYLLVLLTFRTPFMKGIGRKTEDEKMRSCEVEQQRLERFTPSHVHNFTASSNPVWIAFFSAALFAVHPLQTEAVTYVMQRFASLVTFFYLLSLVAYIKSRLMCRDDYPSPTPLPQGEGARGRVSSRSRFIFYGISLLSAILAMKTKENAFTLPLIITLYEFCFFSVTEGSPSQPHTFSRFQRLFYLVPILLTLLIMPLTFMISGGYPQFDPGSNSHTYPQPEYLFTEFRVLVTYLRLLFFPVDQNLDYDYPVFHSFFDHQVILSFIFLSAMFALGVYLVKGKGLRAKGKGQRTESKGYTSSTEMESVNSMPYAPGPLRLMGFGILWFFITLSVESSVIPLWMLICEYRMYLPSVGIIMSVVTGAFMLKGRLRSPKAGNAIVGMLALMLAVLSVAAYQRNEVWGDGIRLWEDAVKKSPESAEAHLNLGLAFQARNMPGEAMEQYLITNKLYPYSAVTHYNLGIIYKDYNLFDKAMEQFLIAIKLDPKYTAAYNNLGNVYQACNMPDKAIEQYLIAIKLTPDSAEAHNNLGNVYQARNMPGEAREQYILAVKLKPDSADAHFNLGVLYYQTGQMEKARRELMTVLNIKPDDQGAQQLLHQITGERQ